MPNRLRGPRNRSGQGLVEYALIIALVGAGLTAALIGVRDSIGDSANSAGNRIGQVTTCSYSGTANGCSPAAPDGNGDGTGSGAGGGGGTGGTGGGSGSGGEGPGNGNPGGGGNGNGNNGNGNGNGGGNGSNGNGNGNNGSGNGSGGGKK